MPHNKSVCRLIASLALATIAVTPALSQQRYRLQETAAVGDRAVMESLFGLDLEATMDTDGSKMPSAPAFRSTQNEHNRYSTSVLAVDRYGQPSAVRRTYSVSRVSGRDVLGRNTDGEGPLQGKTITIRRARGKTTVMTARSALNDADRESITTDLRLMPDHLLPNRDIAIGEEWVRNPSSHDDILGASTIAVMGRLLEIVQQGGASVARARVTVTMTLVLLGLPVRLELKMTGDLLYRLDLHRTISVDLSGPASFKGDLSEKEMTIRMKGHGAARWKLATRWIQVAGKPVATASASGTAVVR